MTAHRREGGTGRESTACMCVNASRGWQLLATLKLEMQSKLQVEKGGRPVIAARVGSRGFSLASEYGGSWEAWGVAAGDPRLRDPASRPLLALPCCRRAMP